LHNISLVLSNPVKRLYLKTMKHCGILSIFLVFISLYSIAQYQADDWNRRDQWMEVDRLLHLLSVDTGMHIADLGCHEGYLSMHLAERVGPSGMIYAVDINNDRLETLKLHAKERGLTSITTILGDYDNPKLPKEILDAVFILDTYHEIEEYLDVLGHVKNSLKSKGKLLILEKVRAHVKGKSRKQQTNAHSLGITYVEGELNQLGFIITKKIPYFIDWKEDSEKPTWILVAQKP